MKISEIITDKYKLRMPPTVYYDLLADVVEAEEKQERILDKISAEVKALSPEPTAFDVVDGNPPIKDAVWEIIGEVRQIIENYKTESEGGEMTESERRSYNKGVASVWKAIAKVTPRKGDYTLLFNAVHGTEKHPNGFNVEIGLMSESEVKANENEK